MRPAPVAGGPSGLSVDALAQQPVQSEYSERHTGAGVPTRLVQNTNDPWASMDFIQSYNDALTVTDKDLMWLHIDKGRAAAYAHLGHHPDQILDWFIDRV